jgi:hypothetical protein
MLLHVVGKMQIVVGDQLTLKNIRASKLWRQAEVESHNRLSWVNEVPGTTKTLHKQYNTGSQLTTLCR